MVEVVSYLVADGSEYHKGEIVTVSTLDDETFNGVIDDITDDQLTLVDDDGYTTIDIDNIDNIMP